MVKTLLLGDQQVSVPGFGAMGLNSAMGTDFNFEQSEPVLSKAVELGCTFWDTAVSSPSNVLQVFRVKIYCLTLPFANLGGLQKRRE